MPSEVESSPAAPRDRAALARGRRTAAALLAVALALLTAAWVFGNPPGAAPDEGAHFIRALGAGHGDLRGDEFVPTAAERRAFQQAGENAAEAPTATDRAALLWAARQTRVFSVPQRLVGAPFGCNATRPAVSAACVDRPPVPPASQGRPVSYTGTYPPFVYIVPGAFMRPGETPNQAMLVGRVVVAVFNLALLWIALALLWSRESPVLAVAGLLVATTPMVLYTASTVNASGPEIVAGLAFVAALLRLYRGDRGAWVWGALAVSGAVLAVSRTLGPALVVTLLGTVALTQGPAAGRRVLAGKPRAAVVALAVLALALLVGLVWTITQQPSGVSPPFGWGDSFRKAFRELGATARQAVGDFGSLDTQLPQPVYALWGLSVLALAGLALWLGSARERLGLLATAVIVVLATVVISAVQSRTGFGVQGRHVLPVLLLVPLLAAETVWRHRTALSPASVRVAAFASLTGFGLLHAISWLVNARREGVGVDSSWGSLLSAPEWSPPLGWTFWIVVVAVSAASATAAGIALARRRDLASAR
ncbi:MAG: DUF2142 domain-containing protein [Solirubrobacteraceae bacterium]